MAADWHLCHWVPGGVVGYIILMMFQHDPTWSNCPFLNSNVVHDWITVHKAPHLVGLWRRIHARWIQVARLTFFPPYPTQSHCIPLIVLQRLGWYEWWTTVQEGSIITHLLGPLPQSVPSSVSCWDVRSLYNTVNGQDRLKSNAIVTIVIISNIIIILHPQSIPIVQALLLLESTCWMSVND